MPTQQQLLEGAQQIWRDDFEKVQKRLTPSQILARAVLMTPFYPARYIQRLIQLGYEPVPPQRHFSILFQRHLYYHPGLFGYARALVRTEGWVGLYRGVFTTFVADYAEMAITTLIQPAIHRAVLSLPLPFGRISVVGGRGRRQAAGGEGDDVPDTDPNFRHSLPSILTRGTRRFLVNILSKCAIQVAIQPFQVVMMRTAAQLVGGETTYSSLFGAFKEIYRTEGVAGFYSGLGPALLGHLCGCVIQSSLWFFFEMAIANISNDVLKVVIWSLVGLPLMGYIPSTYSYPFFLMSNVMAINGCGLAAGRPPHVPVFDGGAVDCYRHLKSTRSLYRGSTLLFSRYAYRYPPPPAVEGVN